MLENKRRIPFAQVEIAYLNAHDPHESGNSMSYGQIADHLNNNFSHLNEGNRTAGSIKRYYQEQAKEREETIRHIRLPASISRKLSGEEIKDIIVSHQEAS